MLKAGAAERFGRYLLLHRIAIGGMAEIFLAHPSSTRNKQQLLVIKRIRDDLCHDDAFVEMFIDEARVVSRLAHPNIIGMNEFGQVEGRYFIALEHVWGESLRTLTLLCTKKQMRFPLGAALYIGAETANALHYAHHYRDPRGEVSPVIHRDVTLGNVVISYDGKVKVLDFGIAKAKGRLTQTRAGQIKGTLSFLAPEQLAGREVGPHTDIYQLGVMLYQTLVGRLPVSAESEGALMGAIVAGNIIRPSDVVPGFPAKIERVLLKAMARKHQDRFATAGELAGALRELVSGTPYAEGQQQLARVMDNVTGERRQRQEAYIRDMLEGLQVDKDAHELFRWATADDEPQTLSVELSGIIEQETYDDFEDEETVVMASSSLQELTAQLEDISSPSDMPLADAEMTKPGSVLSTFPEAVYLDDLEYEEDLPTVAIPTSALDQLSIEEQIASQTADMAPFPPPVDLQPTTGGKATKQTSNSNQQTIELPPVVPFPPEKPQTLSDEQLEVTDRQDFAPELLPQKDEEKATTLELGPRPQQSQETEESARVPTVELDPIYLPEAKSDPAPHLPSSVNAPGAEGGEAEALLAPGERIESGIGRYYEDAPMEVEEFDAILGIHSQEPTAQSEPAMPPIGGAFDDIFEVSGPADEITLRPELSPEASETRTMRSPAVPHQSNDEEKTTPSGVMNNPVEADPAEPDPAEFDPVEPDPTQPSPAMNSVQAATDPNQAAVNGNGLSESDLFDDISMICEVDEMPLQVSLESSQVVTTGQTVITPHEPAAAPNLQYDGETPVRSRARVFLLVCALLGGFAVGVGVLSFVIVPDIGDRILLLLGGEDNTTEAADATATDEQDTSLDTSDSTKAADPDGDSGAGGDSTKSTDDADRADVKGVADAGGRDLQRSKETEKEPSASVDTAKKNRVSSKTKRSKRTAPVKPVVKPEAKPEEEPEDDPEDEEEDEEEAEEEAQGHGRLVINPSHNLQVYYLGSGPLNGSPFSLEKESGRISVRDKEGAHKVSLDFQVNAEGMELKIDSKPWTVVSVNGVSLGKTPQRSPRKKRLRLKLNNPKLKEPITIVIGYRAVE